MADAKISSLAVADSVAADTAIPVVRAGSSITEQAPLSLVRDYILPSDGLYPFGTTYGTTDNTGIKIGGADATEGGYGALLRADGHANWPTLQSGINYNPIEFCLYASAAQGQATGTSGTSTLTWVSGTLFDSSWVGRLIFFNRTFYTVSALNSTTSLTLAAVAGGGSLPFAATTTQTFHYVYTTVTGVCSTSGTTVTRTSGQPFQAFMTSIIINGTTYTVSAWNSRDSVTLSSSAGTQSGATYTSYTDINAQLATIRLQKVLGSWEENLTIAAQATGQYWIGAINSGVGQAYPIRFSSGFVSGAVQYLLGISPGSTPEATGTAGDGYVSLGGFEGAEAMRANRQTNAVNRVDVNGGLAGFAPSLRGRGSDTNVGIGFDTQGLGGFTFTINTFGTQVGAINGASGATGYVELSAGTALAIVNAKGSATDIDLALNPKGAGVIRMGSYTGGALSPAGYITIKDSAGITRRLLVG
jgi:hypothetical protein